MAHRGRFQAQGRNFDESERWDQATPLRADEGLALLDVLAEKLKERERKLREEAFQKARVAVERARDNGGIPQDGKYIVSKTFMVRGDPERRVDLEVNAGLAFVP